MPFQKLYKNIFFHNEEVAKDTDFFQRIVMDYPYFSLAHFFLLKQTNPDLSGYNKIAAETALHINNPFLLNEHLGIAVDTDFFQMETNSHDSSFTEQIAEIEDLSIAEQVESIPTNKTESDSSIPITIKSGEQIKEGEDDSELPLFEPLFATDYFASQGIKFKEDTIPTDKLGKQLKSFTEWLKTMKKVNESKLSGGNESSENSVQLFAEKSNLEEQVITETMAEIFLQQGKLIKAKEIYLKLSLLNPSKNAYFATKIEQIQ
jgi:hypothetical protein